MPVLTSGPLYDEIVRAVREFDPFAPGKKWRVIAGPDPGHLPKVIGQMTPSGWRIECQACGAEFESKGSGHCEKCRKLPVGKQPLVGTITARSRCRRCHGNLPHPVEADHSAFCSRDCYTRFYRHHCLVCEKDTDPQSPDDKGLNLCGRKCRAAYRKDRARYQFQSGRTAQGEQTCPHDERNPYAAAGFVRSVVDQPIDLIGGGNRGGPKLPGGLVQAILETEAGRLRKRATGADIVPDEHWPNMYRVRRPDGTLTDTMNLSRTRDVALAIADAIPAPRHRSEQICPDDERNPYVAVDFSQTEDERPIDLTESPLSGPVGLPGFVPPALAMTGVFIVPDALALAMATSFSNS
jgi:hypothetical protein